MNLNEYLLPLKRWWWLLVASTLVAGVSSYVATTRQPPVYEAHTTLMIGRAIDDPNPTSIEFTLSQQLAATYADIANREPVREATMEALGLNFLPQYLARPIPNSQLIEILVTDTNPLRAQAVANELTHQLILRSPTSEDEQEQERQAFINEQLDSLQVQIQDTQEEIETLQDELGELNSALQIAETQTQISGLQSKLASLQTTFANYLENTQQGATNTLTVIEAADVPRRPTGPNQVLTISLASALAFMLATAAAYLLDYLDATLKTPEEVSRIFDRPVIGYIPEIEESENERPYIAEHPRSTVAEAFRSLRTNLEFAAVDKQLKAIYVTSPGPAEGKTAMAVNLALIMAQGGKDVILLDADLRRPNIHGYLGIPNSEGLSDIFQGHVEVTEALHDWENGTIEVITGGSPPPNPTELLGSRKMDHVLRTLKERADVVIIDGPPFLVADASVLSTKVDGLLVVIRPGHTHRDAARTMLEQIDRVGGRILGVTLNRIPKSRTDYYGNYWYYAPEYTSQYLSAEEAALESAAAPPGNGRTNLPGWMDRILRPSRQKKGDTAEAPVRSTGRGRPTQVARRRGGTDRLEPRSEDPEATGQAQAYGVLRWVDSVGKRQKLVLREGDTVLLGRDRINDVILHSRHVSRRHAVITWRKENFEIADLGSTNGTLVNEVPVESPQILKDGDSLRLFDVELTFHKIKQPGGAPRAERASEQEA